MEMLIISDITATVTNLRYNNKNEQYEPDDEVDPEQPAQEGEVGGDDGTEVGLNLFDAQLPGNQQVGGVSCLALHLLPVLRRGHNQKCVEHASNLYGVREKCSTPGCGWLC